MGKIQQINRKNGTSVFQVNIPNEIVEQTVVSKGRIVDFEVLSKKEIRLTIGDYNESN